MEGEKLDKSNREVYIMEDENDSEKWMLMIDSTAGANKSRGNSKKRSFPPEETKQSTGKTFDSQSAITVSSSQSSDQDEPYVAAIPPPHVNYIVKVEAEASGRDTIITIVQVPKPSKGHDEDIQEVVKEEITESHSKIPSKGKQKRSAKRMSQDTASNGSLETIPEREAASPTSSVKSDDIVDDIVVSDNSTASDVSVISDNSTTSDVSVKSEESTSSDVCVISDNSTTKEELSIFPKQAKAKKRKRPPKILQRMNPDDPYRLMMDDAPSPPTKRKKSNSIPLPVEEANLNDNSPKEEEGADEDNNPKGPSVSTSEDEKHPLVIQPEPMKKSRKVRPKPPMKAQKAAAPKSPPVAKPDPDSPVATTTMQEVMIRGTKQVKLMCVCPCGMMFSHRSGLSRHRRIKHLGMTYECQVCGEHFTRSDSLNDHVRRLKHDPQNVDQPGVAYAYKSAPQITIKEPVTPDGPIETIIVKSPVEQAQPSSQKEPSSSKSPTDSERAKSQKESPPSKSSKESLVQKSPNPSDIPKSPKSGRELLTSKSPLESLLPSSLKESLIEKSSKRFPISEANKEWLMNMMVVKPLPGPQAVKTPAKSSNPKPCTESLLRKPTRESQDRELLAELPRPELGRALQASKSTPESTESRVPKSPAESSISESFKSPASKSPTEPQIPKPPTESPVSKSPEESPIPKPPTESPVSKSPQEPPIVKQPLNALVSKLISQAFTPKSQAFQEPSNSKTVNIASEKAVDSEEAVPSELLPPQLGSLTHQPVPQPSSCGIRTQNSPSQEEPAKLPSMES